MTARPILPASDGRFTGAESRLGDWGNKIFGVYTQQQAEYCRDTQMKVLSAEFCETRRRKLFANQHAVSRGFKVLLYGLVSSSFVTPELESYS